MSIGAYGDYTDPEDHWNQLRQIRDTGAILVRPDHHVAYRAHDAVSDPTDALSQAVEAVLSR